MATIVKTPSGTWKAVIRKNGWPTTAKTFRTKRDAEDWSRRTEDEMVRGIYIQRGASERLTFDAALDRYLAEVTPTKKPATQRAEKLKAKPLREFFGDYALAAIGVDLVARYRDQRLATASQRANKATGKAGPLRPATVRLEQNFSVAEIRLWDAERVNRFLGFRYWLRLGQGHLHEPSPLVAAYRVTSCATAKAGGS